MRRLPLLVLALAIAVSGAGCGRGPATLTILHINDVYEIEALESGRSGGLARVATVLGGLKQSAAPVIATLGGDYLSPSAIGTAKVNGQPMAGQQMVDVLNAVGLQWATFGNHEFDVSEGAFHQRLSEQKFGLVSSNVTDAKGQLFIGSVPSTVIEVAAGGRQLRIGLVAVTIDANRQSWVQYAPPAAAAKAEIARLRQSGPLDAVVALTHLPLAGDQALAEALPEIDVILGGHEHENWFMRRGPHFTPVIKADANVRSAAVVTITFGEPGTRPTTSARLEILDGRVTPDPTVQAVVRKWMDIGFDAFRKEGFAPDAVVATITEPLDGREATVRNRASTLTDLITVSLAHEVKKADLAMFNGGSIRIDDVLAPGPVTEYDVIRVLPFGGKVLRATFEGSLLSQVLDIGVKNMGTGGYLQTWGVARDGNRWLIQGQPLRPTARYDVAISDFLLTGREANLGFLTRTNKQIRDIQEFRDIRQAVIDELKAKTMK